MPEVVVVATLQSQPGKEARFEEELRGLFAPTHAEDGCLLFAMHRLVDDPTRFCVIERWTSADALGAHLGSPHIAAYLEATADLLASPPQIDVYEATPEGDPVKGRL